MNDVNTNTHYGLATALSELLMDGAIVCWWDLASDKDRIAITVIKNDVFCYGAYSQELRYAEFEDLYTHWKQDNRFGVVVWLAKKDGIKPFQHICKVIQREGIWDLDSLGLKDNPVEAMDKS